MKRILCPIEILLALMVTCAVCMARTERNPIVVEDTSTTIAKTNTSLIAFSGYLEEIFIDIPSASTCTVTIASVRETLLTATSISADTLYRVRYPAYSSTGGVLAIATNDAVRACLFHDYLTVTVSNNSTSTNDVKVEVTTKE